MVIHRISNKTLAKVIATSLAGAAAGTLSAAGMAGRNLPREAYHKLFTQPQAHVERYEPRRMTADEIIAYHFGNLKGIDPNADPAKRPAIYDSIVYREHLPNILKNVEYAPKNSIEGRIQRLVLSERLINEVERVHNIPKDNTIAAILFEESYGGIPLQENENADSGFGPSQFQGLRAKQLGMRTIGESQEYRDHKNGKQIKQLLRKCGHDISCVEKDDERVNLLKSIDGMARNLRIGHQIYGNWDEAIQSHRGYVGRPKGKAYLQRINNWKDALSQREVWKAAAEDFERRNDMTFERYRQLAGMMAGNWGLFTYRGSPEVIRVYTNSARTN